MRAAFVALIVALSCLFGTPGRAQESVEDRMRDALRQSVMEMRAAQDQAAQAQSDLQKAQADKVALQAQLDAANARLAESVAKPAAKPAVIAALSDQMKALQARTASLQQQNGELQARYRQAAELARSKDAEGQRSAKAAQADAAALQICKGANAKLIDIAEQVLHLYETLSFRELVLKTYEPLIGLARVKLENLVQDYDDKIHDQDYPDAVGRRK